LKLICGLPLPTFGEAFVSVSVLPETRGCGGSTVWPAAGVRAASPNSLGLAALKGNCDATSSVAASFAVAASWMADTPDDDRSPSIVRSKHRHDSLTAWLPS